MRYILTARLGEGQDRELAALLADAGHDDEVVVADAHLRQDALNALALALASAMVTTTPTIIVDPRAVEEERARLMHAEPHKRMVGAARGRPRTRYFSIPGVHPTEQMTAPKPERVHRLVTIDEIELPQEQE